MSTKNTKATGDTESGGSRRWLILLAMTGSLAMIMLDTTVVAVALPSVQKNLGVDQNLLEWVIVGYLVVLASFMALGGKLGDLFGKPRAFVIGTTGFGLSRDGFRPSISTLRHRHGRLARRWSICLSAWRLRPSQLTWTGAIN